MWHIFLSGWALGLATGTTCLATCAPIYIPYLLAEKRNNRDSFKIVFLITLGRFFSYLAFGAAFGFLGSQINEISRELFTGIAYLLLSFYLILSVFRVRRHMQNCSNLKWMNLTRNPFLLGALTGISFCPAFLIAISQAVDLSGIFGGIILFLAFFIGTSLYIIPISLLGILSKIRHLRKIAMITSLIIAVVFIYKGSIQISRNLANSAENHAESDSLYITESMLDQQLVYLLAERKLDKWMQLKLILEADSIRSVILSDLADVDTLGSGSVVFHENNHPSKDYWSDKSLRVLMLGIDNFNTQQDFLRLTGFLRKVHFKYNPEHGFQFPILQPPADYYYKEE